jgi:uncharacterized protein
MRPVRVIGLYLAFVFVGGALIAPWVYGLVQVADAILPGLHSLASKPFTKYVNRCLMVLALAGLWPIWRAANLCSWRALGLGRRPGALGQMGWGFLFGLVTLAGVVVVTVSAGVRAFDQSHGVASILRHLFTAALTAILVASLEEIAFRGTLFGALRKTLSWLAALVVSSGIYALLHFLQRPGVVEQVHWNSGLVVFVEMLGGFRDWSKLIPAFLNLTLVGVILGLAYQRSGSLYFSIGLHAGWIFWLKTYGFLTEEVRPEQSWFYGTSALINGWLSALLLTLVLVLVSRFLFYRRSESHWKERGILT